MMLCRSSELPLQLIGCVNKHRIHCKARPSRSGISSKPSSILFQTDGTGKLSESRRPESGPSNPAFSLANTVGVLGGASAVSTLDFLEKLIKWSSESGKQSLPFIASNDPVLNKEISSCERSASPYLSSRNTPYQFNQSLIVDNLRRKRLFLERSGARCIVMPCHISHVWYDEVSLGCSVPFLHIGECVADELKAANLKPVEAGSNLRIGVLANEAILTSCVYQEQLKNLGFEAVLLDRATMEHTVFPAVEAITKGDMEGARNLLRIALQVLLVRAVSTVILASSDFHELLPRDDPLLNKCTNPIDSLARSTIQWAKSTEEKW